MEIIRKNNNGQFDVIRWLALAASKDRNKPGLCCINVRKDKATATDGHVLNQYNKPLSTIEPGLWEIVKVNKSEIRLQPSDETFPDTDSVWPDRAGFTEIALEGHQANGYNVNGAVLSCDFTAVVRAMDSARYLNYDLFKIAAEGAEISKAFINPDNSSVAIVLSNGVRESLIMPIRNNN